ncbi:MAG TPA: hypothetical protein VH137_09160 [Gemmatimonadales bacterium]|jgi:hypothetical protein|nr:hypothetical protein [Gemmatimonadales bacterium]
MQRISSVLRLLFPSGALLAAASAPLAAQGVREERVAGRKVWYSLRDVPSRYAHISELPPAAPYYILVSESRRYCVVNEQVYVTIRDNELFPCRWRASGS